MIDLTTVTEEFEKTVLHLQEELKGIRTGRAQSSSVEHIMVDCYGAMTPLKGLASISVPDARTILITPWDQTIAKEIEKALANSPLGANPINEGTSIRLAFSQLTEENRLALTKIVGQKREQTKINMRLLRDRIRDDIERAEKKNELTEDDKFALQKNLDEMTKKYTLRADAIAEEKEKEVRTI